MVPTRWPQSLGKQGWSVGVSGPGRLRSQTGADYLECRKWKQNGAQPVHSSERDSEKRMWMEIVHLGRDPRKEGKSHLMARELGH